MLAHSVGYLYLCNTASVSDDTDLDNGLFPSILVLVAPPVFGVFSILEFVRMEDRFDPLRLVPLLLLRRVDVRCWFHGDVVVVVVVVVVFLG